MYNLETQHLVQKKRKLSQIVAASALVSQMLCNKAYDVVSETSQVI